jgi:hypothetical protein
MADEFFSQILSSSFLIISCGSCWGREKLILGLLGNPAGKIWLGKSRFRQVDNIKT